MFSRIATTAARKVVGQNIVVQKALFLPQSAASVRCVATGNNSEVYIPTDAGFQEFQYESDLIFRPPPSFGIEEKAVDSIDECKWDEPLTDQLMVKFGKNMPTIHDDKAPERDVVNFPRPKRATYPEAVRLYIIPDHWFRAMYEKTGVTGPYALVGGVLTFMLSKEWIIIEHEMLVGACLAVIGIYGCSKFGAVANRYLEGIGDSEDYYWNKYQSDSIETLELLISKEKAQQDALKNMGILFQAKKENVHLQREAEYRNRLMAAFNEVKRKLDYQIASQNATKQFAQKHMVSWIINSVEGGITPTQEKEALAKCILDLKALSKARANAI